MQTKEGTNDNNNNANSSNSNPMMSIQSVCVELSHVYQVLSKCNDVIKSQAEVSAILPYCSDLLSELYQMVQQAAASQQQQQQQQQVPEAELWWDSSPENVAYSECDTMYDVDCGQSSSLSVSSSDFISDSNTSYVDSEAEEQQLVQEIYIDGMVEAINTAAPNNIFDARKSLRKRRKKIMTTFVPKMFRSVYKYFDTILAPAPAHKVKVINPTIDWSRVNKRFLDNLPKEREFPIHGCSEDPKFYEESEMTMSCGRMKIASKHSHDPYPFGSDFGYMTQFGVISIENSVGDLNVPVNGHILNNGHWVLHAQYPKGDKESRAKLDRAKQTYNSNNRGGLNFRSRGSQRRASR